MVFRVIDSETGKIIMDAGDIASLITTIEELGDYEVKQLNISYDEEMKKKQPPYGAVIESIVDPPKNKTTTVLN